MDSTLDVIRLKWELVNWNVYPEKLSRMQQRGQEGRKYFLKTETQMINEV